MYLLTIIQGAVTGLLLWLFFNWLLSPRNKNIPKIYAQPGFWYPVKYTVFRFILFLRKWQNYRQQTLKKDDSIGKNAGYGIKSRNSPEAMDQVQPLPKAEPLAVDAVYFNAGNKNGIFFVAATARRQENVVQTILYLRVPSIGVLELQALPDTWIVDEKSADGYVAKGLQISVKQPMKLWSLSYKGPMRIQKTKQTINIEFDLEWKAIYNYFDFDTDLHPHTMADSIAKEKWSREYFDTLKKSHQTHYEQFGEITGTVHIEEYPDVDIKVQGIRDHSYGNLRDWRYFHRYAINYAYMEDGTALCVGAICMPMSLSHFVIGYVFKPDGTMNPVSSSDFEFYNWGEDGNPPQTLIINFVAGSGKYHLVCNVIDCPVFYMGKEWDAKIHERFCSYTVNGVKGWGISEWDYRNYDGKDLEMKRLTALEKI